MRWDSLSVRWPLLSRTRGDHERNLAALELHDEGPTEPYGLRDVARERARENGRRAGVAVAEGLEVVRLRLWVKSGERMTERPGLLELLLRLLRRAACAGRPQAAPQSATPPGRPAAPPRELGGLFGLATDLVVGGFDVWSLVTVIPRRRKARPAPPT